MKKIHITGLLIIVMTVIIVLVLWASFQYACNPFTLEKSITMSGGWECNWEGSHDTTMMSFPGSVMGGYAGRYLHISNTLTMENFSNPCLFLRTSEQNVKVYINKSPIYEYVRNGSDRSPGSMYHFINLPNNYIGGKLDIYLMSPLTQYSGVVNEIRVGSSISHMMYVLDKSSLELVLAVTITLVGFILFFFFLAMALSGSRYVNILYLSLYIILSGLWMSSESRALELFIQNPRLILSLAFIGQYLAPIPLIAFIIKTYKLKRSAWLEYFIWIFSAYFIITSTLYLIERVEFINTLVFFHILLAACIIMVSFISIGEIRAGNKNIKLFFVGLTLLCLSIFVDMISFYFSSTPWLSSNSFYQLGVFLFIVITIASLAQHMFMTRDEQISHDILLSLAFKDTLTGFGNRTSFDERVISINSNLDAYSSIHMIIMDINGLKAVNDNFGHKEGDRLIMDGARLVNETLGRLGELFRIGGDEFAIIIIDVEPYFIHVEVESLNKLIASYNESQNTFQVSIAYGIDTFNKGHDKDLHSVFVKADRAMYICKENQKSLQMK